MTDLGIAHPADFVAATDSGWAAETGFAWAVCIPTTGELVALVGVSPEGDSGALWGCARAGFGDALDAAVAPVTRFAQGALGLSIISQISSGPA